MTAIRFRCWNCGTGVPEIPGFDDVDACIKCGASVHLAYGTADLPPCGGKMLLRKQGGGYWQECECGFAVPVAKAPPFPPEVRDFIISRQVTWYWYKPDGTRERLIPHWLRGGFL